MISGLLSIVVIVISIFTQQWGKFILWLVSSAIAVPMLGAFGLFIVSLIFLILLIQGLEKCEMCGERIGGFGKKYEVQGQKLCKECIQTIEIKD